jgi:hypothetical protein
MDSWWQLGEWSGIHGTELATYQIMCPFCMEKGNFATEFHVAKKQPNGDKVLNFDTLKCGNCAAYVQVFWSAGDTVHSFHVQPWPIKYKKAPDHYPEAIGRFWLQAKKNLSDQNWDAAAVMARSALQLALRSHDAQGANLKQEIEDLASKGLLPPMMRDWSHNVRTLGNDSAHPGPDQQPTNPKDASDIVGFLDFLLEYLYTLPKRIREYQSRKDA